MTILILVACAVLAILHLLTIGALVEVFRDVRQIRLAIKAFDEPNTLPVPAEARQAIARLDAGSMGPRALILYLSTRCATCTSVARALRNGHGRRSRSTRPAVLVDGLSMTSAEEWLSNLGVEVSELRLIDDGDRGFSRETGLNVTPLAIRMVNGEVTQVSTVPSERRATEHLEWMDEQ